MRRQKVFGIWLTEHKARILDLIRTRPGITGPEIARRFHISAVSARSHIWQINELLDIECVPLRLVGRPGPAGGYKLVDKRPQPASVREWRA